jgi:hypothetical protein
MIAAMAQDPHEVLGVSRFATWPEVRSAFRALARRYHADGQSPDQPRMAAVNAAYEALERSLRATVDDPATDARVSSAVPVGPGWSAGSQAGGPIHPPAGSLLGRIQAARYVDSPMLDFGQYAGWRIAAVAERDPRYLVWLSRQSSGIRFRSAIEQALGSGRDLGRPAAVVS